MKGMEKVNLAQLVQHCQQNQTLCASPRQWQVLHHIEDCRTEKMGTGQYECHHCGYHWYWHHSCRDRHCPQCQTKANEDWVRKQTERSVPAPYFHIVFTLPHQLNEWISQHDRVIYHALFHSAWQTLNVLAIRKYHGRAGMTAVLHTWGQTLVRHVHLHALVPAGVLGTQSWKRVNKSYFLPVKLMSNRFRGLMVSLLREAHKQGELEGVTQQQLTSKLNELMSAPWVVYCKSALEYQETLIRYLARYTHRIGLSNHRIQSWDGEHVRLSYKDYRTNTQSQMTLTPEELLRRFLLHVLPKGFMRVRHYGYMSNAIRRKSLLKIREQDAPRPEKDKKHPTGVSGNRMSLPCVR
ncbi:IS91 family transposase [Marinomonas mediterranea]|uniref:Transposase n=1 Tax=Marinomonas mediterranea (strain ATCC 700492 / JCM 21426 / NBRC 103028 / MMB-1) TaxID=717774 RepID=F2K2Q9_MARM1|nr:IS91 family transposase [Marinomonas mediterranea]ADZ91192.1 transposase [Marinomonas mediterranea MMB-1]WCN17319.1 IS91 family transposase [Marinomonas mediterranea MMB-1]